MKEQVGRGLSPWHEGRAVDIRPEGISQARYVERQRDPLRRRTRRDAQGVTGSPHILDDRRDTHHGLQFATEQPEQLNAAALLVILGERLPEIHFECSPHVLRGHAEEPPRHVLSGHLQPVFGEGAGLDVASQNLAVDEDAVAIEDHEPRVHRDPGCRPSGQMVIDTPPQPS